MEINGATNGLPLHQWARGLSRTEMIEIDWLNKMVDTIPIDELKQHNPAIESVLLIISEAEKKGSGPRDEQIKSFTLLLQKEKITALIHKDEKENKIRASA